MAVVGSIFRAPGPSSAPASTEDRVETQSRQGFVKNVVPKSLPLETLQRQNPLFRLDTYQPFDECCIRNGLPDLLVGTGVIFPSAGSM
jgi:hypothetical protein